MKEKLRVGVIGAGRIGRLHAETLAFRLPEADPVAITDLDAGAARSVAERCGIPRSEREHWYYIKPGEKRRHGKLMAKVRKRRRPLTRGSGLVGNTVHR